MKRVSRASLTAGRGDGSERWFRRNVSTQSSPLEKVYCSGFSRDTEPVGCVYTCRCRKREIHFRELAHVIVGLARLQCEGQASRLEIQGRAEVAAGVQRQPEGRISLPGPSIFFSEGLQLTG